MAHLNESTENWHTTEMRKLSKATYDSLIFIRRDCMEAIEANPTNPKNGKYAGTALYCGMEIHKRRTS